jgi:cellulose synthase (UDP-forming)
MDLQARIAWVSAIVLATIVLTRWVPRHPRWRPFVIALNLAITLRYLWWRAAETLNWEGGAGTWLSLTIYAAEIYGFLIVLHHYLIATRRRKREAQPPDAAWSPSVDVFITTYNEEAEILYRTIVGCQAMEYANKRVHVLDDGNRKEIAALCQRLGVAYIARESREGAKAGNLNHALARTSADLVVTFDADHVPVHTFLTETVGFFRNEKTVQVQTPHHFYNPDLFQDRLRIRRFIANEQDMFYHVVQPGRDVYNSSFFCGSAAVFRRSALVEIGGFPAVTVTEDIHTSVLLHSRGHETVYLDRDLSAGLAPESYSAYVTQRRRWARGTFQVMIRRGGLFLPGLSLLQRVNYFATLWYWLYGIPRFLYLVAPLFFLVWNVRPLVVRDVSDFLVYYIPHLALSIAAFQLVNLGMRRIFWSDVYESCISIQIALTALLFPVPRRRKTEFAVTPKGKAAEKGDGWKVALPLGLLFAAVALGTIAGVVRLATAKGFDSGVVVNTVWASYNVVVLAMGLLLLKQRAQRRGAVRLPRSLSCVVGWEDRKVEAETVDLSETGLALRLPHACTLPDEVDLTLVGEDGRKAHLRGRLRRCELGPLGELSAAVEFVNRTEEQHRRIVELMFSLPAAWAGPHAVAMGAPEHFVRTIRSLVAVFSKNRLRRRLAPRVRGEVPARVETSTGYAAAAVTVDVSVGGASLRLERSKPRPPSHRIRVTIHWNPVERTTVDADVRSVRAGNAGEFVIGVRFASLSTQQREDIAKHVYGKGSPQLVVQEA